MGENTGILHPGEMGIPTATYAQNSGHIVFWPAHGRSSQTCESVQRHALVDLHSLETLCETCSIIVSVCPPHLGGSMISDGSRAIRMYPNQAILPALALAIAMFTFNFLGDGLRDALDPRLRGTQ